MPADRARNNGRGIDASGTSQPPPGSPLSREPEPSSSPLSPLATPRVETSTVDASDTLEPPVTPPVATASSSLTPPADHPSSQSSTSSDASTEYVPRPANGFILFRNDVAAKYPERRRSAELSILAGKQWKNLDDDEKNIWHEKAQAVKAAHRLRYPDYNFDPRPHGSKPRAPKPRAKKAEAVPAPSPMDAFTGSFQIEGYRSAATAAPSVPGSSASTRARRTRAVPVRARSPLATASTSAPATTPGSSLGLVMGHSASGLGAANALPSRDNRPYGARNRVAQDFAAFSQNPDHMDWQRQVDARYTEASVAAYNFPVAPYTSGSSNYGMSGSFNYGMSGSVNTGRFDNSASLNFYGPSVDAHAANTNVFLGGRQPPAFSPVLASEYPAIVSAAGPSTINPAAEYPYAPNLGSGFDPLVSREARSSSMQPGTQSPVTSVLWNNDQLLPDWMWEDLAKIEKEVEEMQNARSASGTQTFEEDAA